MKLVLSLLAVVGFATSLHAGAPASAPQPVKKDYSSLITPAGKANGSMALTMGVQSGQGFSGSGIRSVR